jgi:cytidylate kinase
MASEPDNWEERARRSMAELKWQERRHPRDVAAIVEEQIRRWQLHFADRTEASPEAWPVITISRQFGSLGVALGRRLAERLGFSCWDREIVSEIARRLHTPEETIRAFDEREHTVLDDLFGVALEQTALTVDYGDQLRAVVRSVVSEGRAVIVGRGGQFLVDPQHALRVRLVAPFELRVREVATRTRVSLEEAAERVRSRDRDRERFTEQHFGTDGVDPAVYDVVVNTAIYTPRRAETLVLAAYLAKFGGLPLTLRRADESSAYAPQQEELPATD